MPAIIELNIGPDKVHLIGDTVTVFAARAMPDWTVREFSRVPIYFQGRKYLLQRKLPGPVPYEFRYELVPWFAGLGQESTMSITYDEAYVEERERRHREERREQLIVHPGLLCLYPFLGFAWSDFKERVLGPIGFDSRDITSASALLEFGFFMLEGIFILYFGGGLIAPFCGHVLYEKVLWLDYLLFVLTPLDAAIRYSQVIRGDESPDGFLEWAWPFAKNR